MDQIIEVAGNYTYLIVGVVSYVAYNYIKRRFEIEKAMEKRCVKIGLSPEGPFRFIENKDSLVSTSYDGKLTIDQVFESAFNKFKSNNCLGTRRLLSEEDEKQSNGKVFKKAIFGDYEWQSFSEVYQRVCCFGNGLSLLGMKPKMKIAIFLETKAEWFIASQACFRFNFPVVTVYATLGEDGIKLALNETEVSHVITSSTLLTNKLQKCLKDTPFITNIIYLEDIPLHQDLTATGVVLKSFTEVEDLGNVNKNNQSKDVICSRPNKDDLAIIMFTSGQSGEPKGVMMSHSNFVAAMSGIGSRVVNLNCSDVYIGYLPLAHVLELCAENIVISAGASIGYSSPLTLSDRSSRIKSGTKGDCSVLRPTLMACVPEIMERMRKAVMQGVEEQSSMMKKLFKIAYDYKLKYVKMGKDTPILNKIIFKKTRALLGGRVRAMLSGGAPCDSQTQNFMNICMCCVVGQGYGLTETCGAATVTEVDIDFSAGRNGPPVPCCDIKLVEWEEGGYSPKETPPRGEIHIGGPAITQGYFKKEEKTKEDFYVDENGVRWFKTGDIGQIENDGCLRIIDRKKDLVKLSHGEYLALGNIEAKLKTSPVIDNIWVFANSTQPYCIAFVIPNEKAVRNAVDKNEDDLERLCEDKEVYELIKKAINETAKTSKNL